MKKRKKLGAERLSEFFRQFSVLVESGLSIPETLEIMQQDDTDREFCLACRKLGAFTVSYTHLTLPTNTRV